MHGSITPNGRFIQELLHCFIFPRLVSLYFFVLWKTLFFPVRIIASFFSLISASINQSLGNRSSWCQWIKSIISNINEFGCRRIWRIMQIDEGVVYRGQRPRWITPSEIILYNALYPTKAEFINCFIIHSK